MNILQVPVVAQEDVAELLEEELLLVTSASALATAVLSELFGSQETKVKQIKLTMISLISDRKFDKSFIFSKKNSPIKG